MFVGGDEMKQVSMFPDRSPRSPTESQLQQALLLAAPIGLPSWRLFRRNIGSATMRGGFEVKFGIKGQCDLYGLIRGGQHVEIELKAAGKRIKPGSDQDQWRAWCVSWGVPHVVLTGLKNETVDDTVFRWINELRALQCGSPPVY